MEHNTRSLSEEFYACSPASQSIIKAVTQTTPTSKHKTQNITIPNSLTRSLSEEFHSCSPNTQFIIKSMTNTTPTSKHKTVVTNKENSNTELYRQSSMATRIHLETYGLISPTLSKKD